jgi:hypothetical protein
MVGGKRALLLLLHLDAAEVKALLNKPHSCVIPTSLVRAAEAFGELVLGKTQFARERCIE